MNYDNIKSHKKPGFHPLSKRCIFGKSTGGSNWPPSPSLLRVNQRVGPSGDLLFSENVVCK